MARWKNIIVHCSDSEFGSREEIESWHKLKGWSGIGYHFVILNGQVDPAFYVGSLNGTIEIGRKINGDSFVQSNEIGAHALGYNADSIGVCLIGKTKFSAMQFDSLIRLIKDLQTRFGISATNVLGHCETESGKAQGKTCPNIDMVWLRKNIIKTP